MHKLLEGLAKSCSGTQARVVYQWTHAGSHNTSQRVKTRNNLCPQATATIMPFVANNYDDGRDPSALEHRALFKRAVGGR